MVSLLHWLGFTNTGQPKDISLFGAENGDSRSVENHSLKEGPCLTISRQQLCFTLLWCLMLSEDDLMSQGAARGDRAK